MLELVKVRKVRSHKNSCLAKLIGSGIGEVATGAGHAAVRHEAVCCIARRCSLIFGIRRAQAVVNFNGGALESIDRIIQMIAGVRGQNH